MLLDLKNLFVSDFVTVRHAVARPSGRPISRLEHGAADLLLMPIAGVFAKHDSPRQHVIANSSHALFFGQGRPYRISFPGDIGDESLLILFSEPALADLLAQTAGIDDLRSPRLDPYCLMTPTAALNRDLLWHCLKQGMATPLAIEELCVAIFAATVRAACRDGDADARARARQALTAARRRSQIEAVKEAISLRPAHAWSLDVLARQADTLPFHLARVFREEVGVPVHQYLIRTRLGMALERMRAGGANLTDIALDAGFSTHSHFSACFRAHFGVTPSRLRSRIDGYRDFPVPFASIMRPAGQ